MGPGAGKMSETSPDFPPYSYVPGGPWSHPKSHPDGHSYHITPGPAKAPDPARWHESAEYIWGCKLFNAGYYWEAHETWEPLWLAAGRRGSVADLLKGLIKLAAAGVKVREGVPQGVRTHAGRARDIFLSLLPVEGSRYMGLDLNWLASQAMAIAEQSKGRSGGDEGDAVRVVFDFKLIPDLAL